MNKETFERLQRAGHLTFGAPLPEKEIATDANLSLSALDTQMRAASAERDPWTMTADKLAAKLPGMGVAALQLPDVTYAWKYREEDEQLLREAQLSYSTGIDPSNVTAVIITRGDLPELMEERLAQFKRLGFAASIISESPDIYTRYLLAEHAKTPVVYFQDDDVALEDQDILNLLANYEPGILVSNMYDEWIAAMGYFDLAMVGLGAVCDKGLWREPFARWMAEYGSSDHLLWDADFIFGVLARWRRFDINAQSAILPEASNDNRLWKQEGQHERKNETISMARKLRTVALTMMTLNEQENIHRALLSSKDWWDTLVLFDGGSTDHTVDIAKAFCEAESKNLVLVPQIDGGFRERRNQMLGVGRSYGDYMLLMDADEEWTDVPERPELWAECYMIHYAGSIDYAQPRLIASRFPWKWTGDRHAHLDWDWEGEVLAVNMPTPLIVHHGWERSAFAHENDGEILKAMVERGDDLPRDLFLLGKWYDGSDMFDDAMKTYRQRIALDINDEEDYWCRLRLGNLLSEHANDFAASVETLLEAYKRRPTRIESLRAIAFYCTAVADATPYPVDDITLVLRDQYRVT